MVDEARERRVEDVLNGRAQLEQVHVEDQRERAGEDVGQRHHRIHLHRVELGLLERDQRGHLRVELREADRDRERLVQAAEPQRQVHLESELDGHLHASRNDVRRQHVRAHKLEQLHVAQVGEARRGDAADAERHARARRVERFDVDQRSGAKGVGDGDGAGARRVLTDDLGDRDRGHDEPDEPEDAVRGEVDQGDLVVGRDFGDVRLARGNVGQRRIGRREVRLHLCDRDRSVVAQVNDARRRRRRGGNEVEVRAGGVASGRRRGVDCRVEPPVELRVDDGSHLVVEEVGQLM